MWMAAGLLAACGIHEPVYGQPPPCPCEPCDYGAANLVVCGERSEDHIVNYEVWLIVQDACSQGDPTDGADEVRFKAGLRDPEPWNPPSEFWLCDTGFWEGSCELVDCCTCQFRLWDVWNASYIPFGVTFEEAFCLWIGEGNELAISDVTWYRNGVPCGTRTLPDHAWEVDQPVATRGHGPQYAHRFTIANDDSSLTMELGDILFAWSYEAVPLDTTALPLPADTVISAVTLSPGDSLVADLMTEIDGVPTPLYDGYIYGEYKIASPTSPGDSSVFVFAHFVQGPERVPSTAKWGFLVLLVLLTGGGLIGLRRAGSRDPLRMRTGG